jgi:tetraacyldisaccharide 4'-kinase
VGADRSQTAELLLARGEADVFVLDDGFQHHRLERDLDLVLIDVTRPPFTDALLPAGRLRENARALARADAVLLTRTSPGCCYARLRERIRKVKPELKIWRSRMRAAGALDVRGGADTTIAGRRVFAFCGIGAPQSFWRLVESQGGEVVGRRQFRDHQRYSREDWRETAARAHQAGADVIVTTEKDFANLSVDCSDEIRASTPPLCVLRIEIEIDEEQALLDWIEQSIGRPA